MSVTDIVKDFTPLQNGTGDFLDGSIVEFMAGTKAQLYCNSFGGLLGTGTLAMTLNTHAANTQFLLEWAGYGGYYLWPLNGNKNMQIFLDKTHTNFFVYNTSNTLPAGIPLTDRVFQILNLDINDKQLVCKLGVTSSGTYGIQADKNSTVTAGNKPTAFQMNFVTLGQKAWELLIHKDTKVSSQCCLSTAANYTNFPEACKSAGFTVGSSTCAALNKTTGAPPKGNTTAPPHLPLPLPPPPMGNTTVASNNNTTDTPDNSTTAPPPPPDKSFWQKYMWYIIGGIIAVVLLVIIAIVVSMSK